MHKLLISCGAFVSLALMAGCATTSPGLGHSSGNASLPSGLRLLDSDDSSCDGTVQVGEENLEGHGDGLDGAFVVDAGENATFEFNEDEDEFQWACVGAGSPDAASIRCPRDSTHVRITRATSGGDLLFECYG